MPSNHLILCHPLLLPSIFMNIRVFSNESGLHIRWPKNWSLSFNISPSNEYSGLISFMTEWFELLAVQGTLKNLLQQNSVQFSSAQFSLSVVSDSLWPHEPQHARPPCPSSTLRAYSNSCPLSQWYHSTISSSVAPFSSCPQSLPASGSFQMSQLFASGGQSIGVSVPTSVLPKNTQDWSPLGWNILE